ncbi:response regulator transcription factor [Microbulbifer sp. OS29]|uniref:Response regulator transcription factor n=1 Tax=Microbulbifer okhotskensis TaxID=2926617 RepID=A0A9X2J986_9GAMM|nr:response regulator transcription factor [Microbulbifer okhotskensis]MCO1336376.1 response regulator transcription factor [Microbulbifer okhotskensis]
MIKIIVVEDQAMVLGALRALVNLEPDMQVVATATNGQDALDWCQSGDVDVVISDIEMPKMNGLELAQKLKDSQHPAKVIVLTTFSRGGYVRQALEANVGAYLLKDAPSTELAKSIRLVITGDTVVDPKLLQDAWRCGENPLSEKEQKILTLALEGKSTSEIARYISLSPGTIRNYIHNSCQILNAKNRIEAARLAQDFGWL